MLASYLDARGVDRLEERFPTVTAACREAGIDPVSQLIPVVPGAHYSCGGVLTDVHGRTEISGLFAAGEVARTGMHGANRLASNSLLEGLVVGARAGRAAADLAASAGPTHAGNPARVQQVAHDALERTQLQAAMSRDASVVRDESGLRRLGEVLAGGRRIMPDTRARFEDVALTVTARAVTAAALARTESRGCHHRGDFPAADEAQARSTLVRLIDGQAFVQDFVENSGQELVEGSVQNSVQNSRPTPAAVC